MNEKFTRFPKYWPRCHHQGSGQINCQQPHLLLYFLLIFATFPPSSPPVCVFWFTGWGGRHSKHAHNTTHKHTPCTHNVSPPPTFHTNLQPWLSPFIQLRSLSPVGLDSVCNLFFPYSNFPPKERILGKENYPDNLWRRKSKPLLQFTDHVTCRVSDLGRQSNILFQQLCLRRGCVREETSPSWIAPCMH